MLFPTLDQLVPSDPSKDIAQPDKVVGMEQPDSFSKREMMPVAKAAYQLLAMTTEEREQNWPDMVTGLIDHNPKLGNFISPNDPAPRKQDIQALLSGDMEALGLVDVAKRRKKSAADESQAVSPEAQSAASDSIFAPAPEPKGPDPEPLSGPVRNQVQKRLIDLDTDMATTEEIYDNFDVDAFSYGGKVKEFYLNQKDRLNMTDPKEQAFLARRIQQHQRIDRLMLVWRKYITGVAGGEKEMKRIEETTLNRELSPSQAKASLDLLFMRTMRDREVYRTLLQKGIIFEASNKEEYSRTFLAERTIVEKRFADYIKRFKKVNRGASDVDAVRYMMYKNRKK